MENGKIGIGEETTKCAAGAAWFIRLIIVLGTGSFNAELWLILGALMRLAAGQV
jgi:hypothetical protein